MNRKKKFKEFEERIAAVEQKVTQLEKEMHPTTEQLKDALWEVIQFHQKNQTFAMNDSVQAKKVQLKMPVSQE